MSKKYLTSIDLNKNEIQNALMHPLSSAPGTPAEGQIYYDSTDKTLYIRDDSTWLDIGGAIRTLSQSTTPSVTIAGTTADVTIAIADADTTNSGLLSSTQFDMLDDAVSTATADTLVLRDGSGDFAANDITANAILSLADMSGGASTTAATKGYVDSKVASSVEYQGGYDADGNSPDLDTSPSGITKGDMYTVTVAGTFFSAPDLEVGDVLIAEQDDPTIKDHWTIVNKDLDTAGIKTALESLSETNFVTDSDVTNLGNLSGDNTGDQTDITDISSTIAEFNTACSDADFATGGGTATGSNTGDEVSATDSAEGIIELATQAEVDAGTETSMAVTPETLAAYSGLGAGGTVDRYTSLIGDNSSTTITVTHSLGIKTVQSQVFDASTDEEVICEVLNFSTTQTKFTFTVAPGTDSLRCIIHG